MQTSTSTITVEIANDQHVKYAEQISKLLEKAAQNKGSGLAKRSPKYISDRIEEGKAVIALYKNKAIGFCYIESWGHDDFVANSGLIVSENFRGNRLAYKIKKKAFELSRQKFPNAKLFGLTTSLAVMKINSALGYKPVTFAQLTGDTEFWRGCEGCANYDILMRTERVHCLCTGMLYDPQKEENNTTYKRKKPLSVYNRWVKFKQYIFSKQPNRKKIKSIVSMIF